VTAVNLISTASTSLRQLAQAPVHSMVLREPKGVSSTIRDDDTHQLIKRQACCSTKGWPGQQMSDNLA